MNKGKDKRCGGGKRMHEGNSHVVVLGRGEHHNWGKMDLQVFH